MTAPEPRWLHPEEPARERFLRRGCFGLGCILVAGAVFVLGGALGWLR